MNNKDMLMRYDAVMFNKKQQKKKSVCRSKNLENSPALQQLLSKGFASTTQAWVDCNKETATS